MSCVEKRHVSHRVGSMLHHRFPNGFTDLCMDETDREVSTLTDRAFRSLCVGDDAVYNDDFLCGYSPFSCHKPLAGEPLKTNHNKESKRHGQSKTDKNHAQPWKHHQQKNISHMSSFLKALSATEESCKGMLIKNGSMTDSNGESWDKTALRSIQRELSEFSSDYHTSLTDQHYKNPLQHQSGDGYSNKTGKDVGLPTGKSKRIKNGKSTVKLRKLNIKNFFLHSEFSPFQTWTDFNRFPFGQEDTVTSVLPIDNIPKVYELPLYKELTEAHRKETLHAEKPPSCQKEAAEPCLPTANKPIPPPQPPKVLPKPSAVPAEKRCSSDGGDGTAAPWRRNRSRAKSAIPVNHPGIQPQDNNSKTVDESLFLVKQEAISVDVKAVEEVSSVASTPFSICQLMTPLIPSRQPTETSEILQSVLSPSAFDLPLRSHSEAKVTPELPVKRDGYKSLASSILFNLKDNRKRMKSRYSPPKFKTSELPEGGTETPQSEHLKHPQAGSEGNASGLSTPAIMKDGLTVCSPILESHGSPTVDLTKDNSDRPLSDDYLLSNLLQAKREAGGNISLGEENPIPPFIHSKKNKSPMAKKQNYPSLNLYKKASPVDSDMKYLQVPQSTPAHIDAPTEAHKVSPLMLNKELSPKALPANTGLSPNTSNVIKDHSPIISPHTLENEGLSSVGKRPPNVPEKIKRRVKDTKDKDFGVQQTSKEKEAGGQIISTVDVIRAAREAINAAKNKVLSAAHSDSINKPTADREELWQKEMDEKVSKEMLGSKKESSAAESNVLSQNRNELNNGTQAGKNCNVKKEPPPVPVRNFAKSDIKLALDKQQTRSDELEDAKLDLPSKENDSVQKQGKLKYIFSARQNNYIKYQRFTVTDDEQVEENEEGSPNVNTKMELDDEMMTQREMKDSEHIINDLHALKELGRARLGNRILENARSKLGVINIDEETKAKNDLISRELRNIKRGMLSMRGNTSAKREIFAKKEKEQSKQEGFTKLDSNVIVNKTLINDNYDKAKMALEEIISERERRRNTLTETDTNPQLDEKVCNESYTTRVQQNSTKEATTEGREKQNDSISTLKEKELKERLGDLRDHNHLKQILSLTEPRLGETYRSGGRVALPGLNKTSNEVNTLLKTTANLEANLRQIVRQVSEESGDYLMNETVGKKVDAPPVPPRIKKGGNRRGSVTNEKDAVDENVYNKDGKYENCEIRLNVMGKDLEEVDGEDAALSQSETSSSKERWDLEESLISSEFRPNENKANNLQINMSPTRSATSENNTAKAHETCKIKRKAPLKPDHLIMADGTVTKNLVTEEPNKVSQAIQDENVDAEALSEIPRNIISPLLLVNGVSVTQSPPDQASLSSKSSYFSVESALHNFENAIEEVEEVDEAVQNVSRNTKGDSDRAEVEYYSLSDHESEPEVIKQPIKSRQQELEVCKDGKERENVTTDERLTQDENNSTTLSPVNIFSPTLGIPALFKVKDNTFSNKFRKTIQPWSPRGSLSGSERGEDELHHVKECQELTLASETSTSGRTLILAEILKPKEISSNQSPPQPVSPSNLQNENLQKTPAGGFLTVPQEEDRFSGLSPSSEGVESLTPSTADTSDETVLNVGVPAEDDATKAFSESLGSTCSGNESQTGLLKPPPVLPKSEKAVLKAIKLANRRMKKEEAQKSSHRSSQSSSKHRAERHKADRSEHKSTAGNKNGRGNEKKHRGKTEEDQNESYHSKNSNSRSEQLLNKNESHHRNKTEIKHETLRQDHESLDSNNQRRESLPSVASERQGRSSSRHIRDKTEQRHYSSDRVISNVPVYKAHVSDKQVPDRPLHRTQSTDRYLEDKVERRLSADMSASEKLDPRTQRIEKSIMDELQQRGRARDKASRDNPLRRSHSIDAYATEVPHPSSLSCQSSHTSQLSRQSSIEHAIVTQTFPMTQRKLLQDPDSGQYFFVDMPVQVKTKTFFDPQTGSYVQLPVQPPDGAVPKASPMEVLSPPLVVYHSFVPVPLSPMAPKATVQAPHMEPEDFGQRNIERSNLMYCKDAHPYLEPIYGQNDHMLGEFIGTEELDCPS